MQLTAPTISVCIPTYNNEKYLNETLESIVSQTFKNIEIIVVDDNSCDGSRTIVHQHAAYDDRIKAYANEQNLGMVANWNRCLSLAQGKYIKFVFGDDFLSTPDALEQMVMVLESSPATALVASGRAIVDDTSQCTEVISSFPDGFDADGKELIGRSLRRITRVHNLIGEPSAVMFRKDFASRGFDPRYRQLVDVEMWFHLLEQGRFAYLAQPFCSFRHHEGQQTRKNIIELNFIDDLMLLFENYLSKSYAGVGRADQMYMLYYQFYKLLKHARQGLFDQNLVLNKIDTLYGRQKFAALYPFYRIYTPYWQLKRLLAGWLGHE